MPPDEKVSLPAEQARCLFYSSSVSFAGSAPSAASSGGMLLGVPLPPPVPAGRARGPG
jgi:hypothetical protein